MRRNASTVVVLAGPAPGEVLAALGSLRHGPWWPGLDEVIEAARQFYPDSLAGGNATGLGPATPGGARVRAG